MFTRRKGELYILQTARASYHHTVARMAYYRCAGEDGTYQSSAPGFNDIEPARQELHGIKISSEQFECTYLHRYSHSLA